MDDKLSDLFDKPISDILWVEPVRQMYNDIIEGIFVVFLEGINDTDELPDLPQADAAAGGADGG